jgi:glycerol transport system permease protein
MITSTTPLAYVYLAPALLVMLACGVVPMLFILFYSLHDTFSGNDFVWVGGKWYAHVLTSSEFYWALARSLGFSALVLAIEIPLGIYVATRMPTKGWLSALLIIIIAIPLLTPSLVVGYLWKVMVMPKAGLLFEALQTIEFTLNMNKPWHVWGALAMMDAWHWTSLVVLLCLAGLRTIPEDYYRAARIDGASRWKIFRYVELPRLKLVLLIAVLLRLIDSFIMYTEAYVVTRGGPGVTTTFLSHELVQTALIQFDLGEGSAMAIIYFAIVCMISWFFYNAIIPKTVNSHAA